MSALATGSTGASRHRLERDIDTHDPTSTYLHLGTGSEVAVVPVDHEFWATIDQRTDLHTGRLVMASETTSDWDMWEMHPAGDEVIMVTSGAVRIHVDDGHTVDEPTVVRSPHLVVMPAGTWHTIDVIEPARVITITWGAGTEHRKR